jgi:hypothetical protein
MTPKTLAYYPLHYGAEYLRESILSIEPCVDKIVILYTSRPSYGHQSGAQCPETEQQLKDIALATSNKVQWENVSFNSEGDHRMYIWNFASGYDLILPVDADEVWDTEILRDSLRIAHTEKTGKYIGVSRFVNFWKSFNRICIDSFVPIRIYKVAGNEEIKGEAVDGLIYHFSCAQSDAIMRYKYAIHGHHDEIRTNWLEGTYFGWKEGDKFLHPTSLNIWGEALPFDKETLPEVLKYHPNFNKEIIG